MGMKIFKIIIKDLKTVLSDKKALEIILLMPIVLMVILNFGMRGVFMSGDFGDMSRVKIAVVKQYDKAADIRRFDGILSSGFLSRGLEKETAEELKQNGEDIDPEELFLEDFLADEEVAEIIEYRVEEEGKAIELLNRGEVSAVMLLPEGFVYNMKINLLMPFRNKVHIRVLTHPDRYIEGQVVQSIVEAYSDAMSSVIIGKNVLMEAAMEHDLADDGFKGIKMAMEQIRSEIGSIRVDISNVEAEGRKDISSADYYAVAMMTMFILFAADHGGRMLLEEKDNMTYHRMIAAGMTRLGILSGKFFTVFLIALLQIGIMITFSYFVLKVQWGSALPVLLISLAGAFSVAGVGSALAAATFKAGNYKMANIFETAVIQTMALLGGSFFPTDILPPLLQRFSFLSLNGTALKAYLKIMMGYGMEDVIGYIGVLTIIGALFLALSALILGRKGGAPGVEYNKLEAAKVKG